MEEIASPIDEENPALDITVQEETTEPAIEEVPTPAQVVAHEILNELQQSIEVPETEETEAQETTEENEPAPQIDYSKQLSDINNTLSNIYNEIDTDLQSVTDRQDTLQNEIILIKQQNEEYMEFFYVTNSLFVGLFVAILFFKGLKK